MFVPLHRDTKCQKQAFVAHAGIVFPCLESRVIEAEIGVRWSRGWDRFYGVRNASGGVNRAEDDLRMFWNFYGVNDERFWELYRVQIVAQSYIDFIIHYL